MQFKQLFSGSSGNAYIATFSNGMRLLIECGVTYPKLLQAMDYDLSNIYGCVITHEHKDHCAGVQGLIDAGIHILASEGTLECLGLLDNRLTHVIKDKSIMSLDPGMKVRAFGIEHDAKEPLGFIIRDKHEYMLFATDTHYIRQRFDLPFKIIAIECSYDLKTVESGVKAGYIDERVAQRLFTSHMEKGSAIEYLKSYCNMSKCEEIHLLHMSETSLSDGTQEEFEETFFTTVETIKTQQNADSFLKGR